MSAFRTGLVVSLLCSVASGQVHLQKFTADAPLWGDKVGTDLAIDGDVLALSRPGGDVGGIPDRGSVLIYRWSEGAWLLEQELVAPHAAGADGFGPCALAGNVLVVGAPFADMGVQLDAGAVHVFHFDGSSWNETQVLLAPGGDQGDRFGAAVAVRDDLLVVGAPFTGLFPNQGGSVYVHRWDGAAWSWETTFSAGGDNTRFGTWLAINEGADEFAVGAPEYGGSSSAQGFVRLYEFNGSSWTSPQAISFPDFMSPEQGKPLFGRAALRGDLLVVGAPGFGDGAAYAFRRAGEIFALEQQLFPPDASTKMGFGSGVDISGEDIAIGSAGAENANGTRGAVYVYRWDGSEADFEFKLAALEQGFFGDLGQTVAFDGPLVVAGAPMEKVTNNAFQGSATVFSVLDAAWAYQGGGLPGEHGVPDLLGHGTLVASTSLSLRLREAREGAAVALFVGLSPLGAAFKGGTLVPSPDIIVLGLATNASGELALSTTWPNGIPAGFTLWLQAWVQDPAGAVGWAASNALSATQP